MFWLVTLFCQKKVLRDSLNNEKIGGSSYYGFQKSQSWVLQMLS